MITEKTVLILGAGASIPYGFPSGQELRHRIFNINPQDVSAENQKTVTQLLKLGHKKHDIEEFVSDFKYSGKYSVDAFLEHRQDFMTIGKDLIALMLMPHEEIGNLFSDSPKKDNWYEYLFNKISSDFERFEKNKLSILTYNYDRSLEFYLLVAIQKSYKKSHGVAVEKLKYIPIIHLHGNLGALPGLSNENSRDYVPSTELDNIRKAANGIKIIHEGIAENPEFKRANELLAGAKRIIFLGFGYDQINMSRLGLTNLHGKTIIGSTHGLTRAEWMGIKKNNNGKINFDRNGFLNLEFLRNITPFDSLYGDELG